MLGQYAEAKKSPCSDIRAKTFYKGFTCLNSLSLGRGKLTFCTKNIHYLIQFSVRMERLSFTSTVFEWDPCWKFLWVRRWGEQKRQCQLAAIRTHSVHFMPHGMAREKPNSQTIAPNSDVLLSLKAATACYLRLCSLAEGLMFLKWNPPCFALALQEKNKTKNTTTKTKQNKKNSEDKK